MSCIDYLIIIKLFAKKLIVENGKPSFYPFSILLLHHVPFRPVGRMLTEVSSFNDGLIAYRSSMASCCQDKAYFIEI